MLGYEEYLAPARPSEVLDALREAAEAKGWLITEDHSDGFFCLEGGTSVRVEPRKLAVSVEDLRLESKIRLIVWCSGFTVRRYDGKVDLIPALPYACERLTKDGVGEGPLPVGPAAAGERGPSLVALARFVEFGLVALSLAAIVFFAVAIVRDMPRWSAGIGLAVAAVASLCSGLALDLLVRRELKIASRSGMQAQLRRAGISAAVAVLLLIWLWRM